MHHFVKNIYNSKETLKTFTLKITPENLEKLRLKLADKTWEKVYRAKDVDEKYDNFIKILQTEITSTMPKSYVSITGKPNKFYWTEELIKLRKSLHIAHRNYKNTGTHRDRDKYRREKTLYDLEVNRQKSKDTKKRINEAPNRTRQIWNIINNKLIYSVIN